ncbi:hypothetical protein FRC07_001720 [Ceratobasidium sp. 392]|nr:hypothetical protein FRC07_001720 [Ceratobasidium sp. 392]
MAMDMMGEGVGVGVVALEQNDDLAMGAPSVAPGAVTVVTPRPRVPLPAGDGLAPLATTEPTPTEPPRGVMQGMNPGPYGDEEVLFSLQLLAYLSKYPRVRQAFYETPPTLRHTVEASAEPKTSLPSSSSAQSPNVFSLVERFTFRPSPSETTLPRLPNEIQYWAGVIMRNACRKDDQRGGTRQCVKMLCGRWEEFPREFAKCRRCRKAMCCGKECQSKAWAEGHRFWCSRGSYTATTITRALVNIAGGMTGRGATPVNATRAGGAAATETAGAGAGCGTAGGVRRGQVQGGNGARAGAGAGVARGVAGAGGNGNGSRFVRPLAVPATTRPFGTTPPPAGGATTNWRGAQPTFNTEPTGEVGPSGRSRGPETQRRRSGTMPSGRNPTVAGGTGGGTGAVGGGTGGGGWTVVPVERVSPPSAPYTTPLQVGRGLEEDEVMGD